MALNRSLEFKSSNPKPSAAELFWYLRPPFEQTQKSSTMQSTIPNFKHLSQVVLKQKIFFILPMYFYASNPGAPGVKLDLNKLGKGLLGNATYQISNIWAKWS